MANYNYGRYLPAAVASVQAQTYTNWEMIICDDGSTDESLEVIARLAAAEPRLRGLSMGANGGQAATLNAAYDSSRGELLCLLDADDTWMPRKLEAVIAAARRAPAAGLLPDPQLRLEADGRSSGTIPDLPLQAGWFGPALAATGNGPPLPFTSGVSLRREAAARIFPLPERFRTSADTAILTLALALTSLEPVSPAPLSTLRLHGGNDLSGHDTRNNPERLERTNRLQEAALALAREKSQLPGPWPLPWAVVMNLALAQRLRGELSWRAYRQALRRSPNRPPGRLAWSLFFEYAPALPLPLYRRIRQAASQARAVLFRVRRRA